MSREGEGSAARRSAPRWLWGLLAASVALNLVAAGMIGGRYLRKMEMRDLGWFNARLLAQMPETARAEAREILTAEPEAARAIRADLVAASQTALAAFRAEPFDRAAMERALAMRRQVLDRRQALREARIVALGEELPHAVREAFAQNVAPRLARRAVRAESGQD